jgi:hypothetical protein
MILQNETCALMCPRATDLRNYNEMLVKDQLKELAMDVDLGSIGVCV